jgi:lipid A 3-O-deacylase
MMKYEIPTASTATERQAIETIHVSYWTFLRDLFKQHQILQVTDGDIDDHATDQRPDDNGSSLLADEPRKKSFMSDQKHVDKGGPAAAAQPGARPWFWRTATLGPLIAGLLVLSGGASAVAADQVISELKVGVMSHDVSVLGNNEEQGVDVNAEILFASPEFLSAIWSPRPHLGLDINTDGDTSQLYLGLTWKWQPFEFPLWGAFSTGGSVHSGETGKSTTDKELGSLVLFRQALEIGYDLDDQWSASVYFSHISNASLADENEGLNNLGLRIGFRF